MEIEAEIKKALGRLHEAFRENELAYLSLTSKPELQIRDRLAFLLHRALSPERLVVREYQRIDIAILKNGQPDVLIQLKTWSLFTFLEESPKHFREARADIEKCQERFPICPAVYSLIVATHIESRLDGSYRKVVKYWDGWRRAFEKLRTSARIKEEARKKIDKDLAKWHCAAENSISGGKVFDVNVSLLYWLCKPMQA